MTPLNLRKHIRTMNINTWLCAVLNGIHCDIYGISHICISLGLPFAL